ncbi:FAD-dependent oxidoreductase [Streptomyces sp. JJ66]|uniref:dihydrolipoyl dehydrogenase family protein n=1 Tax=Streptomyces sp. JJ66 TaxID=2803843 RepID=UPI001C583C13|nr:FAD-dependent oxidoreductase [Streptomyces sp. JJ66]MBW1603487.1 FAD-dependent oxidoreductase [Streptomyces sp. JJ66]
MERDAYDLVVIGGGSAGLTGARTAARLGARTLLVERDRLGGDCLWRGCVPSKALLHAAARGATFPEAMAAVRRARRAVEPQDSAEALAREGVEVAWGAATFTGPRTLSAGDRRVRFRYALLATGSAPAAGHGAGELNSDTLWEVDALPKRVFVRGGGPVGCELAQALARLGARVTLAELGARLLPGEEPRAGELVRAALEADGVRVVTGREARPRDGERLLDATGRRAATGGLGLAAAHVSTGERGQVRVDGRLRTSNRRVYAAGDVTGRSAFTHLAGVQAASAVVHALLGVRRPVEYTAVPRVTFTDPEVAAVGTSAGARQRVLAHDEVDRAIAEDRTDGYTSLTLDRRGRVVGATVVAPRAGETIAHLATAVRLGWTPARYARTVHPYPTYADGPWQAALTQVYADLRASRVTGPLLGLRRWLRR